jgi:GNAT superfamily N-acetyltransferase
MRRTGIGARLIAAAECDFEQRKITRVAVDTRLMRQDAHQFYEKLGYKRSGFRFSKILSATLNRPPAIANPK